MRFMQSQVGRSHVPRARHASCIDGVCPWALPAIMVAAASAGAQNAFMNGRITVSFLSTPAELSASLAERIMTVALPDLRGGQRPEDVAQVQGHRAGVRRATLAARSDGTAHDIVAPGPIGLDRTHGLQQHDSQQCRPGPGIGLRTCRVSRSHTTQRFPTAARGRQKWRTPSLSHRQSRCPLWAHG